MEGREIVLSLSGCHTVVLSPPLDALIGWGQRALGFGEEGRVPWALLLAHGSVWHGWHAGSAAGQTLWVDGGRCRAIAHKGGVRDTLTPVIVTSGPPFVGEPRNGVHNPWDAVAYNSPTSDGVRAPASRR